MRATIKLVSVFFFIILIPIFYSCSEKKSNSTNHTKINIDKSKESGLSGPLSSCNEKNLVNTFKHNVVIDKIEKEVSFRQIVKEYKYIKLETNDQCLIGDIKKMLFYKDRIYILSGGVYCFDIKGHFLFAINKKGVGPSDYIRIDEMNIDDDKIYIYDNSQWRILSFNSNSGTFIRSFKLPYSVPLAVVVKSNLFIDRSHFQNKFVKGNERILVSNINKPDQIKRCFFPEKRFEVDAENQFSENNGQVYFIDPLYNKVYKIHPDSVENLFYIDGKKNNLSEKEIALLIDEGRFSSEAIRANGKASGLKYMYENKNFIISQLNVGNNIVTLLFEKKTNRHIVFENVKCELYQIPPVEIGAVYNDYFCKTVPAHILYTNNQVEKKKKKIILEPNNPEFKNQNIYNGAQLQDNPIIAMYRFKSL